MVESKISHKENIYCTESNLSIISKSTLTLDKAISHKGVFISLSHAHPSTLQFELYFCF